MSIGKKLAHKAEAVKGATKKYFGRATGNTRLRTEGRVEQAQGNNNGQGPKPKTSSSTDPLIVTPTNKESGKYP